MYCALEGIKGSGKSTVLALPTEALMAAQVRHAVLRPYAAPTSSTAIESAFRLTGKFWPDWAVERLYAHRSNECAARAPWRERLLLSDRSVLTSYVTRWNRADPWLTMARVDALEPLLRRPDHVFLLEVPVGLARKRIVGRRARPYGVRDEEITRLQAAADAYKALAGDPSRWGLQHVRWHHVDASRPVGEVADEISVQIARAIGIHRLTVRFSNVTRKVSHE